jgi:hypothetical protein
VAELEREGVVDLGEVESGGPTGELWWHLRRCRDLRRHAFLHHEGSGGQVAQPLRAGRGEHRYQGQQSDGQPRPVDDDTDEPTDERMAEPDRTAVVADDPQAHHRLARGPPAPEGLEADGVAQDHTDEQREDKCRRCGGVGGLPDAGGRPDEKEQQHGLHELVDDECDSAGADAGRAQRNGNRFTGHDRLAVRRRVRHAGSLPCPWTSMRSSPFTARNGRGSRRSSAALDVLPV